MSMENGKYCVEIKLHCRDLLITDKVKICAVIQALLQYFFDGLFSADYFSKGHLRWKKFLLSEFNIK